MLSLHELAQQARAIVDRFVLPFAPMEINVSGAAKRAIRDRVAQLERALSPKPASTDGDKAVDRDIAAASKPAVAAAARSVDAPSRDAARVATMFDDVEAECYSLMSNDSYFRFLKSAFWRALVAELLTEANIGTAAGAGSTGNAAT